MTLLYLVRHAKPAATWSEAPDPGLDAIGHEQARSAAETLHQSLTVLPIYTSPLQRCRETAAPLVDRWTTAPTVLLQVAEIPSPPLAGEAKRQWLTAGMQGTWNELQSNSPPGSPNFATWRAALLQSLLTMPRDSVIFTHYIAINVAVGAAQGHERVISFKPGHASITKLEIDAGRILVRELGTETTETSVLVGK